MKKIVLFMVSLLVLQCVMAIISVDQPLEGVQIKVTLVSQDPDPIEPGHFADLRFKVENLGSSNARNVRFRVVEEYPFSMYASEKSEKDIGSIQGQQTGDVGVVVKYRVIIDKGAVEGTNEITVEYSVDGSSWIEVDPFDINIRSIDATLSVASVETKPEVIAPGNLGLITVKIKNLADSTMDDIKFRLDLSDSSTPLAPVDSVTEKKIKKLSAGKEQELDFRVRALPDSDSGLYKIPVNISYYDEVDTKYSVKDVIGIMIGADPDLVIFVDDSEIKSAGQYGKVSVKLVNKGVSDVKFLHVKLRESDDYKILSAQDVYLGNVDSDDYETADFDLYVNPKASEVVLPLDITFMDANNREYNQNLDLPLKTYSSREATKYGLVPKKSYTGTVIFLLLIAGGGYWYYKKKWKKKKGKK